MRIDGASELNRGYESLVLSHQVVYLMSDSPDKAKSGEAAQQPDQKKEKQDIEHLNDALISMLKDKQKEKDPSQPQQPPPPPPPQHAHYDPAQYSHPQYNYPQYNYPQYNYSPMDYKGSRKHHGHHGHKHHHSKHAMYPNEYPYYPQYGPPPGFQPPHPPPPFAPPPYQAPPFQPPPPPFQAPPPYQASSSPYQGPPPPYQAPPPPPYGPPFGPPPYGAPFVPGGLGQMGGRGCWQGHHSGWGKHGGHKGSHRHKKSRSKSRSSSSSSEQKSVSMEKVADHERQFYGEIQKYYANSLEEFFTVRKVGEWQREKILRVLMKWYSQGNAPLAEMIKGIEYAEEQKLMAQVAYVKAVKIMLKNNCVLELAIPKIYHIHIKKKRKFEADRRFHLEHGGSQLAPPLDVEQLIGLPADCVFLVDGNNIFSTNKHFRKYFQSYLLSDKIEAQLRMQWMVSHALPQAILFFDEQYLTRDYNTVKQQTFTPENVKQLETVKVIYGANAKADARIVETVTNFAQQWAAEKEQREDLEKQEAQKEEGKGKGQVEGKKIVVISADRDLVARCGKIFEVQNSSGKPFFKLCRYKLSRKFKDDKPMRSLLKSITQYSRGIYKD